MNRGEVFTALFAFSDGSPPKSRPMLVIQSDFYNQRIKKVLLATITSNLARAADPAHVIIDVSTSEGAASGLRQNSLVSCLNLVVLPQSDVKQKIGVLSDGLMQRVDAGLRAALGL